MVELADNPITWFELRDVAADTLHDAQVAVADPPRIVGGARYLFGTFVIAPIGADLEGGDLRLDPDVVGDRASSCRAAGPRCGGHGDRGGWRFSWERLKTFQRRGPFDELRTGAENAEAGPQTQPSCSTPRRSL